MEIETGVIGTIFHGRDCTIGYYTLTKGIWYRIVPSEIQKALDQDD